MAEEKKAEKKDLKKTLMEREKTLLGQLEQEVKKFNELTEMRSQSGNQVQEYNARLKEVRSLLS